MQQNNFTISNILILISIVFTFLATKFIEVYKLWMNSYFIENWEYLHYIQQFFSYSFTHWNIMHLLWNSIFIFIFWNMLENILLTKRYLIFFIFITVFNWVLLSIFSWETTVIWISWFVLAILTYYTLELKSLKNPEYKWWITAIILSIWIWLMPWISLLWHLFWTIWWAIFYYINKDFFFRQKIWLITRIKKIFKEPKVIKPENIKKL